MATIRDRFRVDRNKKTRKFFQVDFKDANGVRRRREFATLRAAREALLIFQEQAESGPAATDTVSCALDCWLVDREIGSADRPAVERATLARYRTHVELHIRPRIGHLKLAEMKNADVQEFVNTLLRDHTRAMAKKILRSACSAINLRARVLDIRSPFHDQKIVQASRDKKAIRVPSRDDIAAMVNAAYDLAAQEKMPQVAHAWRRYLPFILLAIHSGARMSELRGLCWGNILWEECAIFITQRADEYGEIGRTKTKKSGRKIDVPREVIDALKVWEETCPQASARIKVAKPGEWHSRTDLVFPTGIGTIETLTNIVRRCWVPLLKKAGLFNPVTGKVFYTRHELRHYFATLHIWAGATVKDIQYLMGHASAIMTLDTYGDIFDERDLKMERRGRVSEIEEDLKARREKVREGKARRRSEAA